MQEKQIENKYKKNRNNRLILAITALVIVIGGIIINSSWKNRENNINSTDPNYNGDIPTISASYLAYLKNTCIGNIHEAERCATMYPQLRSVFFEATKKQ